MKVLVSIKRTIDYNVRIQIRDDGSGVVTDGVKHSINPFDEIAIEQAVRWKESGHATEVVAVTIGPDAAKEQLRSALAFGCDRAIHVLTDAEIQPLTAARVLARIAATEQPQLLLLGKQAIDDDSSQTGPMAAALLDWPQATFASDIALVDSTARVTREVDAGLETLEIDLPGVITVDLRLNEPRYLKLPDIMKARKKSIDTQALDTLGVEVADGLQTLHTSAPAPRPEGIRVDSAEALVATLRERNLL